jgi:hypothetical protein
MNPRSRKLVVCYVSGLDLRRVTPEGTPFLAEARERLAMATLTNLPSNELFPTLVTGVDPMTHGVWGVKLKQNGSASARTLLEHLPEQVATTVQCMMHAIGRIYDLAAVPPRRRKRFHITRTKYKRRTKKREALHLIGGVPTVFDIVGSDESEYFFNSRYDPERSVLPRLCAEGRRLEVLELYSLDRHQQWNSDHPQEIRRFYAHMDKCLRLLDDRCRSRGWTLLIVSDHGHEPIRVAHDLEARLAALPFGDDEYSYFLEVSNVRFWFHSERARQAVTGILDSLSGATVFTYEEMERYGIPLPDASYGELFVYLDPGYIFFPHDFHHPLANLWLGLRDPMQRARLSSPRHRGNHGHLPHFDAEKSFALLLERGFSSRGHGTILDVAPTILDLLGLQAPQTMKGTSLFRASGTDAV